MYSLEVGWCFNHTVVPKCFNLAGIGAAWPILLGGQAHWTVGLVATLICCSSIIAADTYAFMGGKVFRLLNWSAGPLSNFNSIIYCIYNFKCDDFL